MLSAVLERRANRTGQNPLATDTNAVPDELQEKPHHEQHLRSAAFLPWQERRERSDAATRSNSEQRKREYVESAPQHQERVPQDGYVHCVTGDACNKPSSYAGVAKATRDLEQRTETYLQVMTVGNWVVAARLAGVDSELEVKLGNLCSRAFAEGVTDETAAIAACKDSHLTPTTSHGQPEDSWKWVDQQLRLKALASGKGQAPTRLPSISLSIDMAQLQLRGLRGLHEQRMAAAKLKYRTQVEQLTNDVHELGLQRDRMGQSDKDTRAASNAIKEKLRTARHLLKEAALYQALGSGEDAAADSMTEEQH
ncbi:hypothetical protein QJQ45_018506 [Haematococcus lacustris]|nr:hypothetical protein QJQ45_018506 [Haematococcus lacustris]